MSTMNKTKTCLATNRAAIVIAQRSQSPPRKQGIKRDGSWLTPRALWGANRNLTIAALIPVLLLTVLLAFPTNAVGQIDINGVTQGRNSYEWNQINTFAYLDIKRDVASVKVYNDGSMMVSSGNFILGNYAFIETASVFQGSINNRGPQNGVPIATIGTANIYGGSLSNFGTIGTANIDSGTLFNHGHQTSSNSSRSIDTANVNGGTVYNSYAAGITTMNLYGGTVNNAGYIDNLTYFGGTYNGTYSSFGTIGTLTVAGDSRGSSWGNVDLLQFVEDGSGIVHITGLANGFSGIQRAQNVDLTYGKIVIDLYEEALLNTLFADTTIDISTLLRAQSVTGMEGLVSLEITWDTGSIFVYSNNTLAEGWMLTAPGWEPPPRPPTNVPEPATLVVLGLGLAGLGLARRRRS